MKLINLYSKSADICYKSPLCSVAALFSFILKLITIVAPMVILYNLDKNLFNDDVQVFEQPQVQFTYKYLFLGENTLEGEDALISSSSFHYFNKHTEEFQESISMKYTEGDLNKADKTNEMTFVLSYDLPFNSTFRSFSLVLYLDALIQSQCAMRIPAAIIMNRKSFNNVGNGGGELIYSGDLKLKQTMSLKCPYFMRQLKTNFNFKYSNDNATSLSDFQMPNILAHLYDNPAHFYFDERIDFWKQTNDNRITIKIHLKIGEENFRYSDTMWNTIKRLWMQYLSILIVFVLIAEKVKYFFFTRQIVKTWETFPFLNKKFN